MTSPAPVMGGWNSPAQQHMPANEPEDAGVQTRPMSLKVHYTFDKEAKVNCLARYQHTLQIQTLQLNETTSIGIVDLRSCIQAVTECSPELAGQDCDYTIYAVDHSEPNTPLVGQGNLSWALDSLLRGDTSSQPKLVTGRVTKNLLGMFSGGNKETLEVTLRLAAGAPKLWAADSFDMQAALTPSGASEWNSFLQANPQIGDHSQMSRVASPAMSQGMPVSMNRRDSFGPAALTPADSTMGVQRVAPIPVDASQMPNLPTGGSSRPSSRTSNRPPRKRPSTGRPVGRPRKRPVEDNTSGYEDGTEGEDAPVKKRAKTTKVERAPNPFVPGNESLRVTVSTSASLRNIRPVNNEGNNAPADHLQEVPRAPTPVPKNASLPGQRAKMRRESTLGQKPMTIDSGLQRPLSPSQEDGRSPESNEPTPSYSVESPGDIGSSPPMARATPYLRSSPPPSSPMLPPMPNGAVPREDTVMTENGDLLGDEQSLPPPRAESRAAFTQPAARLRKPKKPLSYPVSVFQMQDGPQGQDLVHICSYNSRPLNPPSNGRNKKPSPVPAVPVAPNTFQQVTANEQPSLPPLNSRPAATKPRGSSIPSPPLQEPTPPPTTDAIDKATSPVDGVDVVPPPAAEPIKAANIMVPPPIAEPVKAADIARPGSAGQADKPASQAPKLAAKPRRPLSRSQSSGPLALPAVPASEPIGPSSLSRASMPEAAMPVAPSRRGSTHGALTLPIPASDPAGPPSIAPQAEDTSFFEAPCPPSEAAAPPLPSSPGSKPKKNMVKKDAIRNRLEQAILNGEMPPFCNNCGAIETPTWRKIWTQEHPGVPPKGVKLSGEPGKITSLDILERDEKEVSTRFRITKKSLGPDEDKHEWRELLLCNPCGIWLAKWNAHRPKDRWDRDASRLGQDRKPRGSGRQRSRAKRAPRKIEATVNPTSEAYLHTDAVGPVEPSSPKAADASQPANLADPVSTHSRASGTAKSPINVELDTAMGVTKRLLFPSPRKEGVLKTLGDVMVNLVQTSADYIGEKVAMTGKENAVGLKESLSHDELEALFRSPGPAARPSTPPPNGKSELSGSNFKTPTQPTPNHRPITRSVSRSIRSVRSILASPGNLAMLQRTPTKTPRAAALAIPDSASRRRSPRHHQAAFDIFDTPITRTINQMLSEPNGFGLDGNDIDLGNLPSLDAHNDLIDFGALLSTDAIMPSSPPKAGSIAFDYDDSDVWANWGVDGLNGMDHQ